MLYVQKQPENPLQYPLQIGKTILPRPTPAWTRSSSPGVKMRSVFDAAAIAMRVITFPHTLGWGQRRFYI